MVELKIRKFGNSLGVVLPKEVINRLQTRDVERVFLIEAGDGDYRLTPYDPAFERRWRKPTITQHPARCQSEEERATLDRRRDALAIRQISGAHGGATFARPGTSGIRFARPRQHYSYTGMPTSSPCALYTVIVRNHPLSTATSGPVCDRRSLPQLPVTASRPAKMRLRR
jgi:antitoxin component of MazEF toxin-antitoxin module